MEKWLLLIVMTAFLLSWWTPTSRGAAILVGPPRPEPSKPDRTKRSPLEIKYGGWKPILPGSPFFFGQDKQGRENHVAATGPLPTGHPGPGSLFPGIQNDFQPDFGVDDGVPGLSTQHPGGLHLESIQHGPQVHFPGVEQHGQQQFHGIEHEKDVASGLQHQTEVHHPGQHHHQEEGEKHHEDQTRHLGHPGNNIHHQEEVRIQPQPHELGQHHEIRNELGQHHEIRNELNLNNLPQPQPLIQLQNLKGEGTEHEVHQQPNFHLQPLLQQQPLQINIGELIHASEVGGSMVHHDTDEHHNGGQQHRPPSENHHPVAKDLQSPVPNKDIFAYYPPPTTPKPYHEPFQGGHPVYMDGGPHHGSSEEHGGQFEEGVKSVQVLNLGQLGGGHGGHIKSEGQYTGPILSVSPGEGPGPGNFLEGLKSNNFETKPVLAASQEFGSEISAEQHLIHSGQGKHPDFGGDLGHNIREQEIRHQHGAGFGQEEVFAGDGGFKAPFGPHHQQPHVIQVDGGFKEHHGQQQPNPHHLIQLEGGLNQQPPQHLIHLDGGHKENQGPHHIKEGGFNIQQLQLPGHQLQPIKEAQHQAPTVFHGIPEQHGQITEHGGIPGNLLEGAPHHQSLQHLQQEHHGQGFPSGPPHQEQGQHHRPQFHQEQEQHHFELPKEPQEHRPSLQPPPQQQHNFGIPHEQFRPSGEEQHFQHGPIHVSQEHHLGQNFDPVHQQQQQQHGFRILPHQQQQQHHRPNHEEHVLDLPPGHQIQQQPPFELTHTFRPDGHQAQEQQHQQQQHHDFDIPQDLRPGHHVQEQQQHHGFEISQNLRPGHQGQEHQLQQQHHGFEVSHNLRPGHQGQEHQPPKPHHGFESSQNIRPDHQGQEHQLQQQHHGFEASQNLRPGHQGQEHQLQQQHHVFEVPQDLRPTHQAQEQQQHHGFDISQNSRPGHQIHEQQQEHSFDGPPNHRPGHLSQQEQHHNFEIHQGPGPGHPGFEIQQDLRPGHQSRPTQQFEFSHRPPTHESQPHIQEQHERPVHDSSKDAIFEIHHEQHHGQSPRPHPPVHQFQGPKEPIRPKPQEHHVEPQFSLPHPQHGQEQHRPFEAFEQGGFESVGAPGGHQDGPQGPPRGHPSHVQVEHPRHPTPSKEVEVVRFPAPGYGPGFEDHKNPNSIHGFPGKDFEFHGGPEPQGPGYQGPVPGPHHEGGKESNRHPEHTPPPPTYSHPLPSFHQESHQLQEPPFARPSFSDIHSVSQGPGYSHQEHTPAPPSQLSPAHSGSYHQQDFAPTPQTTFHHLEGPSYGELPEPAKHQQPQSDHYPSSAPPPPPPPPQVQHSFHPEEPSPGHGNEVHHQSKPEQFHQPAHSVHSLSTFNHGSEDDKYSDVHAQSSQSHSPHHQHNHQNVDEGPGHQGYQDSSPDSGVRVVEIKPGSYGPSSHQPHENQAPEPATSHSYNYSPIPQEESSNHHVDEEGPKGVQHLDNQDGPQTVFLPPPLANHFPPPRAIPQPVYKPPVTPEPTYEPVPSPPTSQPEPVLEKAPYFGSQKGSADVPAYEQLPAPQASTESAKPSATIKPPVDPNDPSQVYHAYYAPADHVPPQGYVRLSVKEFNKLFKDADIQYVGSESQNKETKTSNDVSEQSKIDNDKKKVVFSDTPEINDTAGDEGPVLTLDLKPGQTIEDALAELGTINVEGIRIDASQLKEGRDFEIVDVSPLGTNASSTASTTKLTTQTTKSLPTSTKRTITPTHRVTASSYRASASTKRLTTSLPFRQTASQSTVTTLKPRLTTKRSLREKANSHEPVFGERIRPAH